VSFYAVWPYFVCSALILLLANTPLLGVADLPPTTIPARTQTIDGLRGFLALAVFFHHAAIYHQYLITDLWDVPPSRFYANLGPIGVALFFMITGYLFWTKMLETKGRPDLLKLYVGRIFRIVPLYLLLGFIVILFVGYLTEWSVKESKIKLTIEVARWLSGGLLLGGDINSIHTIEISAGVTWTLQYEWLFYASLIFTCLFARHRVLGALLPIAGSLAIILIRMWHPNHISLVQALIFLVGMTAGSMKAMIYKSPNIPQYFISTVVLICFLYVAFGCNNVFETVPIIILGILFLSIIYGATVYGLLLLRPTKRLGDVSYGIYLLQGPILYLAFASPSVRSWATASAWDHWSIVLIAAGALVLLATLSHSLIERPGIKAGLWIFQMLITIRRRIGLARS